VDLGRLYREARERVTALISGLDAAELGTWVPTCPAWTVQVVVGHLVAIPEDVLAGRLAGVPSDDFTAGQVARFAGVPVADRLARWAVAAPQFEELVSAFQVWPALIDVASHEQDIRSATGRPGERDSAAIRECTHMLMSWLEVPVSLRTVTEDGDYRAGPPGKPDHADQVDHTELVLTTTRFEAFRWRMGRRSRAQLAALAWSADPAAVLDHLAIFGPAASDIVE
jgi:uncharacterized protein (TIGR03083 family)